MKRRPWVGCAGSKIQFAYWSLWTNTVALVDVFAVSPYLVPKLISNHLDKSSSPGLYDAP